MQLVKLGGSLITAKRIGHDSRKAPRLIFRSKVVDLVARELKKFKTELILVHGAGSFGHFYAHAYGLDKSYKIGTDQTKGAALVSQDVRELNLRVNRALGMHGLYCMAIPPNSTIINNDGKIDSLEIDLYKKYLAQGLIPITFGDLVYDTHRGISICSGDDIMFELAKAFKGEVLRTIFVTDVDGVFESNPNDNVDAKLFSQLTPATVEGLRMTLTPDRASADVTGGIYKKAEICSRIAELGVESVIINGLKRGRLSGALRGERVVGTYFLKR